MKNSVYYAELGPFREIFRRGIPVLCYHKISRKPPGAKLRSVFVSPRLFQSQMKELRGAGYRSISIGACLDSPVPNDRKISITFDDGSLSVLQRAAPVLAECGFHAINYLVPDKVGGWNDWDIAHGEVPDRLMDWSGVKEWLAAGNEVGAHTRTHPRLTAIPLAEAREEIIGSKKILEDRLGIPIRHFCYPYGSFNAALRDIVAEAGFDTAVTTKPGLHQPADDPLTINRLGARAHSLNFRNIFRRILGLPLTSGSETLQTCRAQNVTLESQGAFSCKENIDFFT